MRNKDFTVRNGKRHGYKVSFATDVTVCIKTGHKFVGAG